MATGLRQHSPGAEDPWGGDEPGLGGFLQPAVQPAGVANRREAAPQHALEDRLGLDPDPGERAMGHGADVHLRDRGVDVGVDEPGHDRSPAGVEAGHIVAGRDALTVRSDLDDAVALDAHARRCDELASGNVEQRGSLDHETRHGALQVYSSATGRRRYRSAFVELIPAAS